VLPDAADAEIVSQPEGDTPLLTAGRRRLGRRDALLLKHDGHNPTARSRTAA
jgi:threonine synthase